MIDPFEGAKLASELSIMEYTFAYEDNNLAYIKQMREIGNNLKAKDECPLYLQTQFMEFANQYPMLDGYNVNKLQKRNYVVQPYLDDLYERAAKKYYNVTSSHLSKSMNQMISQRKSISGPSKTKSTDKSTIVITECRCPPLTLFKRAFS